MTSSISTITKKYISQNLKLRFLSFLHQSTILRCPIRDATLPNEQRQRFMEEISRASASTFSQAKLPWTRQAKTAGQTFFIIYCFFSHFLCIDCLLTFRDKTWPYPISVPELMNILKKENSTLMIATLVKMVWLIYFDI